MDCNGNDASETEKDYETKGDPEKVLVDVNVNTYYDVLVSTKTTLEDWPRRMEGERGRRSGRRGQW